jgi:hypothetical protein
MMSVGIPSLSVFITAGLGVGAFILWRSQSMQRRSASDADRGSVSLSSLPVHAHSARLRVALVDASNVRACMGRPPRERFYKLAQQWSQRTEDRLCVLALDGGGPAQEASPLDACTLLCASGPRWSADDVLARDTSWWLQDPAVVSVLVVTSDKRLKARCRHAARCCDGASRLRIETSEAFAASLRELPCGPPAARIAAPASASLAAAYIDHVAQQPRPPNTNQNFVRTAAGAVRR